MNNLDAIKQTIKDIFTIIYNDIDKNVTFKDLAPVYASREANLRKVIEKQKKDLAKVSKILDEKKVALDKATAELENVTAETYSPEKIQEGVGKVYQEHEYYVRLKNVKIKQLHSVKSLKTKLFAKEKGLQVPLKQSIAFMVTLMTIRQYLDTGKINTEWKKDTENDSSCLELTKLVKELTEYPEFRDAALTNDINVYIEAFEDLATTTVDIAAANARSAKASTIGFLNKICTELEIKPIPVPEDAEIAGTDKELIDIQNKVKALSEVIQGRSVKNFDGTRSQTITHPEDPRLKSILECLKAVDLFTTNGVSGLLDEKLLGEITSKVPQMKMSFKHVITLIANATVSENQASEKGWTTSVTWICLVLFPVDKLQLLSLLI